MANAYRSVLKDAVNPTGNALPADVLAGKTFSNADGIDKSGTMVNNGAVTITLTAQDPSYTIPEGYHNGGGTVSFTPSGGDGADLIVTCSDAFAGATISCTDGTTTFTEICPSTSPYVVTFESIPTGTWTASGVVEGKMYSQQVVITDFDVTLTVGFDYKQWVTLGGLDPTDYASLSAVFADEVAVRRLMTIHASADYLIEKVTDDIDTIDDFTANDTAMKWIGLRDYVCDGLTAITGVEAKFLASQYWERYLKDHVPVMTAASTPYGTAQHYKIFDGSSYLASYVNLGSTTDGASTYYEFPYPVCIKAFEFAGSGQDTATNYYLGFTAKIEVSDDGSTWTEIDEHTWTKEEHQETFRNPKKYQIANTENVYALYVRFRTTSNNYSYTSGNYVGKLNFYGRALNVSVPVMTSNTAPYGEVSASGYTSATNIYYPWRAFAGSTYGWIGGSWIQYEFTHKIVPKIFIFKKAGSTTWQNPVELQGSNDGNTYEAIATLNPQTSATANLFEINDNSKEYQYLKLEFAQSPTNANGLFFQFYGIDYSEREFATGSTIKYLYDHGVELQTIDISGTATKGTDYITLSAANAQASHTLDLTDYDLLRAKVGDHMSGTTALIAGTTATANMTAANAPNNESLDVSSVNASLAAGTKMTGAGVCDITELWLE